MDMVARDGAPQAIDRSQTLTAYSVWDRTTRVFQEYVDPGSYEAMRSFRKPVVTTHLYMFYILAVAILLHIVGVIVTDIREKQGLISAMVTGEKVLSHEPIDSASQQQGSGSDA